MTSFIGLDLGTSFIKGAVLEIDRPALRHITRVPFPDPVAGLPPLSYEVDPQAVVAATQSLLQELLAQAPDCAGIVMCSQMHGLVLTTERGEPLSNVITWQDQRALMMHPAGAESYFSLIENRLSPAEKDELGQELKPSLPLCVLFWFQEQGQLPQDDFIPANLPNYILAQLSRTKPTTELTNAGAHGALNLKTLHWHEGVLTKLGLDHLTWPEIRPAGEVVCQVEIDGRRLPCYTPIGDHQCALLGAYLSDGELSLNIGTASQVSTLTRQLHLGAYQTRPFFDGRYLNTVIRIPAGRSLNGLLNLLTELAVAQGITLADPWDTIAQAVAKIPQTDLTVDLSFFASAMGDRGEIGNIRENNLTVGHLFRAAFESMAENYLHCAQRLAPDQESPQQMWERLVFSGGLVQKIAPLQEAILRRFNLDYRFCASAEDTLLGLLALAHVCSGRSSSLSAAVEKLRAEGVAA